ncbi:hypothetical protein Tco_0732339 [Tanacetum coccineum]
MHTRASNSELVEPLPEPKRILNRRLHRRNRRVPYDQKNNPPQYPRIVYSPILNINYFRHFLDILRNYDPMEDEPMWAADRVVAPTPGSAITIPKTVNKFAIKGNHLTLVKGNQFVGRTKTDPHKHIHEFLGIYDMFKYRDTENEAVRLMIRLFPPALFDRLLGEIRAFSQHENEYLTDAWLRMKEMLRNCNDHNLSKGSRNTDTDKIIARMDDITIKMDAQYKELQSRAKQPTFDVDDDDIPMSREEEAKFMQTFCKTRFYNDYRDRDSNRDNWRSNGRNDYNRDNYRSNTDDKPYDLHKQFNNFMKSQQSTNAFVKETFIDLNTQLETVAKNHQASIQNLETKFVKLADKTERMIFNINSAMKHSYSNDDTCFSIDVIDEILEESFDALLDEGSKILHSIERTLLEEEIFSKFNEFIAMAEDENSESDSETEEPPFEKITINTYYKIKTSLEEPLTDLELKPLPDNLEYVFLEEPSFLPVIISSQLSAQNKLKLVSVLKKHKEAFA